MNEEDKWYWIFVVLSIAYATVAMWNIMHIYEGIVGVGAIFVAALTVKVYIDYKFDKLRSKRK